VRFAAWVGTLVAVAVVAVLVLSLTTIGATLRGALAGNQATGQVATPSPTPTPTPSPIPTPSPSPNPTPPPPPRSFTALSADLTAIVRSSGARASVSLIELGGSRPANFYLKGDFRWVAASTYKLPLLMAEAQGIAGGKIHASDVLCYRSGDFEPGPFGDYYPGKCFRRDALALRVGHYSDNTAAHILVRYLGGGGVLNAYARSMGAKESAFYYPNTTTSSDLARLWKSEAVGKAGGVAAQKWLYPLLTKTAYEAGIPAGTPGARVVHKIGDIGSNVHDAALVVNGPRGAYVLVVCSDGLGGAAGWRVLARISKRIWQFESARTKA
jgi:beta-lactamase class A